MLRIAIRLVNDRCISFIETLIKYNIEIVCIVDGNARKWGEYYAHFRIPIVSPYKALEMYKNKALDRFLIMPYLGAPVSKSVFKEMMEMGIPEECFLMPAVPDIEANRIDSVDDLIELTPDKNATLYRLQYHIADHCNMNCSSCSHFSSLVREEIFVSVEEIKKDLLSLKQLVKHIDRIDILGGEPFLNKQWKDYISITREIYPYTDLTIITNGTLIKTMSNEDWEFLRKNNVCYRISIYPPLWNKAEEIVALLKEKKVQYLTNVSTEIITDFANVFRKEPYQDAVRSRRDCMAECNQLWHGRMAPCNQMMYVRYFNDYFGESYPIGVPIENIDSVHSFYELEQLLSIPMELCKYCNTLRCSQPAKNKWKRMSKDNNNSIEDWFG